MHNVPRPEDVQREVRELLSRGASNEQFKRASALRKLVVSKLSDQDAQALDDWRLLRAVLQDVLRNDHGSYLRAACGYLGYGWTQKSYDEVYNLIEKAKIRKMEKRETTAEEQERHLRNLLRTSEARRVVAGDELDAKTARGVRNHDAKVASALADSLTDYCRDAKKIAAIVASHPEISRDAISLPPSSTEKQGMNSKKKRSAKKGERHFGDIGTYIEKVDTIENLYSGSAHSPANTVQVKIDRLLNAIAKGDYHLPSAEVVTQGLILVKQTIVDQDLSSSKVQVEQIAATVGQDHILGVELLQIADDLKKMGGLRHVPSTRRGVV